MNRDAESQRQVIVQRARALRAEIAQHFTDVEHWNNNQARKDAAAVIDPDPDGILRRMADGLDRMLDAESKRTTRDRSRIDRARSRGGWPRFSATIYSSGGTTAQGSYRVLVDLRANG